MVLRRPERSVECSDSEKKMSACADQNHAPSLTCVRLECVNDEIEDFFCDKRLSKRLSLTSFCANGNRPAFIGGGSERDETAVK